MTKYILHGGETKVPNEHNKAFYQSWVQDFESDFVPTILLVYLARPIDQWPKLEQQDKERFADYTNNRKVNFIVADEDTDSLRDQIKAADVIMYVRGGSSDKVILSFLPLKDELVKLFDGKTYAGSSAGGHAGMQLYLQHKYLLENGPWYTPLKFFCPLEYETSGPTRYI